MRYVITAFAITSWLVLGYVFYTSSQECCTDNSAGPETALGVVPVEDTVEKKGPLLFNWSESDPSTSDVWATYRDSIISGIDDNEVLEIIGQYRSDEINDSDSSSIGLARAAAVAKMFSPPLAQSRIHLKDELVDDAAGMSDAFESIRFHTKVFTDKVKEMEDYTVIYFPYNSTAQLDDAEVSAYLDKIVERLNRTEARVQLTGHTDATGSARENERLGRWRAEVVKNYLVNSGIEADRIITISRGSNEPVADNSTEAGRAENRRTELQIIND